MIKKNDKESRSNNKMQIFVDKLKG